MERVYPRGLSLYPSSLGPDLRTPSTGNQTCRGPTGPKGLAPGVIPEKTPSAVQSTHQSLRQFRDTPRVLRYAPVEKKEEMTPTWYRRIEEVGEICPEKIKDVELRSERENKDLSSRRTVRRVSQLGSGNPGVASLPEERGGLPCSRKPTTPEDIARTIDLTSEQTINGEAARRLTGIVNLTSSISARQRWARNHGTRTRIISLVLNRAGMSNSNEDVAVDLHPDKLKKHQKQIEAFMHSIEQTTSPFSSSIDKDQLYF
ncbi:hypothetical protein J6590_020023 [Homalodisca vitripennis]|nr:hypothetical protein J6590_020023 [Homalodisca vitripennis]